jgi:nitrile hydratase
MSNSFDHHANHPHDHGHDHDHDDHAPVTDGTDGPPSEFEILSRAMQELLEARGVISAEQIRRRIELFEEDFPYRGGRVVARAWTDPAFKQRLLEDGRAACAEMGIELEAERLIAVENTPETHNLIVCTLCSCYPRALLGMPPTWYKSRNYRSRVVFEPRTVLREFGTVLPDSVTVRVHDSNADMRYVVVPMRPEGTESWSEERLAGILTRDTLVGVTVPQKE